MKFTPEQKALNDFFASDMTYIIPEYQRPYSWDCIGKSDKNNQVNVMWQDLITFFDHGDDGIYFMGSMVMIGDELAKREFEVVDGQQRLTTLTILFVAIKCLLLDLAGKQSVESERKAELLDFIDQAEAVIDGLIFNKRIFGAILQEKKVKIARFGGFDYDDVLKTVMECDTISKLDLTQANEEQRVVSNRFFANRDYFIEQLRVRFLKEGLLTFEMALELNAFIEFLKYKVTMIRIQSPTFEGAYHVFEILNNRGLPLSNKDLFRNFLIKEFSSLKSKNPQKYATLEPNQMWRTLESDYDFKPEFMNRYVESKLGRNQELAAFDAVVKGIYERNFKDSLSLSKVELFYEDFRKNLEHFDDIINLRIPNKQIRNRVQFLLNAGNLTYILNLLLALWRCTSAENERLQFLKTVERHVLFVLIVKSQRFRSSILYTSIRLLNSGKFQEAQGELEISREDQSLLQEGLQDQILDHDLAKLLVARYYWATENQSPQDVIEQSLDFGIVTLEHIIPQNPEPGTNWTRDFSETFRLLFGNRLGNFTLLTQSMNARARNFDFASKQKIYAQAKLAMTRDLAAPGLKMDTAYISNRSEIMVDTLTKDLELN